jgi:hypothetical protein
MKGMLSRVWLNEQGQFILRNSATEFTERTEHEKSKLSLFGPLSSLCPLWLILFFDNA